jgi:hypothetical protein
MKKIYPLDNFFKLDGLGRKGFSDKMVAIATCPPKKGNTFPWKRGLSCLGEQLPPESKFPNV